MASDMYDKVASVRLADLPFTYLLKIYSTTLLANKKYEQVWKIEIPIVNKDKTCNKKCQTCEYYN